MYTAFCTDTRAALSDLWTQVQKVHAAQTRNNTTFKEDYAESENARLEADKKNLCAAARERIAAIMDKADADAATLDALTPLDIDPDSKADKRILTLLGGQFTLNVEQLQHIVDEYVGGNRALLNAIATYCEVRGMKLNRATTETRRAAIAEIRASALSVVSRIEKSDYRNGKADLSLPLIVSEFCTDSNFGRELCQRLGQDFSGTLLSPVVESADENRFNFSFRGVRDSDKKAG